MAEFIRTSKGGLYSAHKGFLYNKTGKHQESWYWRCATYPDCSTRATTTGEPPVIKKVGKHDHAPDQDKIAAKKIVNAIKSTAAEHPEMLPANIVRAGLSNVGDEVLPKLPERPALKRALNKRRQAEHPRNPQTLSEVREIPDEYRKTLSGEAFLMYDSRDDESDDDDGEEQPRAMIFSTRNNLRLLGKSSTWFLDGTFSVAPLMFMQLFTIHAIFKDHALPLVYALLTHKTEALYSLVLQKLKEMSVSYHINLPDLAIIISDFEMSIINTCKRILANARRRLCFFHLGQSLYRKIQAKGLQAAYVDPEDREIKIELHMLLSLAFVPTDDVIAAFEELRRELLQIADDFETTYIQARRARTRRPATAGPPRYPLAEWNQYEATLTSGPRTNNKTEGLHNRFNALVGKRHPSFYHFVRELQKKQRDTEVMIAELSLGRRVKVAQLKKYQRVDDRLKSIALEYYQYKDEGRVTDYLRNCGINISL